MPDRRILGRRSLLAALPATLSAGVALASAPAYAQPQAPHAGQERPMPVVASFSILADITREIGGRRAAVTSLAPVGTDMHHYQPRPSEARDVATARVFVINGLGLEGWAERLAGAAGFKGTGVVATKGIKALTARLDHAHHGHAHTHGKADIDPHCWQDVANVRAMLVNIRDGLSLADPAGAVEYDARASAYGRRLDALDAEIRAMIAPIPRDRRRIVTTHDSFNYYADAYAVDFLAAMGMSADAEPSARAFAALIGQIRKDRIRALFLEHGMSPRLMDQLVRETGVRIGGTLYADSLSGPDGPAPSYVEMMRANTRAIVTALAA